MQQNSSENSKAMPNNKCMLPRVGVFGDTGQKVIDLHQVPIDLANL